MKKIQLMSLVVLGLVATACDPYDDVKSGTPNVVAVTASNQIDGVDAIDGTATGGAWTVAGVPCGNVTDEDDVVVNAGAFDNSYFLITFDRQIDGGLVQTSLEDCTPVAGSLTITPDPATGNAWYTCYTPSAGSPSEGGSIVVYQAATGGSSGWSDFDYVPAGTYHIAGTVAGQTIDVTITPDAACTP